MVSAWEECKQCRWHPCIGTKHEISLGDVFDPETGEDLPCPNFERK